MGWPRPDFPPNVEYGPVLGIAGQKTLRVRWQTFAPVLGAVEFRAVGASEWRKVYGPAFARRDHDVRLEGLD
ncbi:MAG: hypothetical protein AAGD14_16245, partial [Planctomycetota bacterium]